MPVCYPGYDARFENLWGSLRGEHSAFSGSNFGFPLHTTCIFHWRVYIDRLGGTFMDCEGKGRDGILSIVHIY
jgi:hypothetical protein